ncbi:MAG: protein kinase domain-containing protein [Kofleriaceae bacterium]
MSDDTLASRAPGAATSVGDEAYCPACGESFGLDVERCPKDGARLVKLKAQVDPMLGRVLDDRYEVRAALGEGGMGTVYRGWQLSVDREVAIKVIHAKLATDRIAVKRFLREARLSSRLTQPSIVNVYDFGQSEDGTLFLVMELLKGQTLASLLESMRPLPLKRVVTIALQLCDALESAHGQGIIHRDLKPGNIIVLDDPPGRDLVKVLDFGLAKSLLTETTSVVTHSNAMLGTPLYMPPEQIDGRPTDQASDFYSFGCILYQMMTGRPPFLGDSVNLVLASHMHDPIPALPPHVPPQIASMVTWMMAKDPSGRVASARAVRDAFEAALAQGLPPEPVTPDLSLEHIRASGYASTHDPFPAGMSRTMIGPGVSGNLRVSSAMQPAQAAPISISGLPRASSANASPGVAARAPAGTMFGAVKQRASSRSRAMALGGVGAFLALITIVVIATRGGDEPATRSDEPTPTETAPAAAPTATPGAPTVTPIDETPPEKTLAAPPPEPVVEDKPTAKVRPKKTEKTDRPEKPEKPEKRDTKAAAGKPPLVDPFPEVKADVKTEPKTEVKPEPEPKKPEPKKPETKKPTGPSIDFYKKKPGT